MTKKEYYNLLAYNGYINLENVLSFLKENFIADFMVIAAIIDDGMNKEDYKNLQEVIDEIQEKIVNEKEL